MQLATAKTGTNTHNGCGMILIRGSARKGYRDGGGKVMRCVYLGCEINLEAKFNIAKTCLARIYRFHDAEPHNHEDTDLSGFDKEHPFSLPWF
jgi:hypothetical protein